MIRVVVFLIALAVIAGGFAWFADRPGDIVLTWMGYRIETSLMVALVALLVLIIAAILIWSLVRGIWRAPEQVSVFFRHRRAMKGYLAVSRGLIAVGSGDFRLARRSADDAGRLSPGEPLALLLEAQAAQMAGDRSGAERAFRAMAHRQETKLLGLRGLYIEAQRRNDHAAARRVAEEAMQTAPAIGWAGQAVLDDRCAAADWTGALAALENVKSGLEKTGYRRKRAVLLTARALTREDSDRDGSRADVLEAVKLAPDFVPAAALAGRRLAEAGEHRKARRMLERAWTASPHPDIAEAYADVRLGDSARERLSRMQKLANMASGHVESALAVARAALDAREFAVAREALTPYLAAPTQRVAALMAAVEEAEHGDTGRAREWMARAVRASGDPAWTADGVVSDKWLPVTPSGRLDGFEWRVPLAEIGNTRPVIEVMPPEAEPADAAAVVEASPAPAPVAPAPLAEPVLPAAEETKPPKPRPVEPVIPLVHAPDDPGPDAGMDAEPGPETAVPGDAQRWQKIKDLFK
ncbi:MAG TPA: heme biosynthesis HemY N-terminal domain-containing protein [Pseudolabrys sp.]